MNIAFENIKFRYLLLVSMVFFSAIVILSACGDKLKPSSQAEIVHISIYHPCPPSYILKTVVDLALLDSGESIQIETTKWAAVMKKTAIQIPEFRVERATTAWDKRFKLIPTSGGVEAILDRKIGLICVKDNCAHIYSICPPWEEMRFGKKCSVFTFK